MEPSDPCLSQLKLQIPVSVYGTFRPLSQVSGNVRPLSHFTEPSDPCLSIRNLQTPASACGTFRPLSHPTEPSDHCLSLRNLQTPVSVSGTFRPLSKSMEPSDPCLSLRNLQTPTSANEKFRRLSQSQKPSDPIVSCCYSKIHSLLFLFLLFTQVMSLVILPVPSLVMRKSRSLIFILLQMDHHTKFVDRVFQISQIKKLASPYFLVYILFARCELEETRNIINKEERIGPFEHAFLHTI
jgi:hypothetical protein